MSAIDERWARTRATAIFGYPLHLRFSDPVIPAARTPGVSTLLRQPDARISIEKYSRHPRHVRVHYLAHQFCHHPMHHYCVCPTTVPATLRAEAMLPLRSTGPHSAFLPPTETSLLPMPAARSHRKNVHATKSGHDVQPRAYYDGHQLPIRSYSPEASSQRI